MTPSLKVEERLDIAINFKSWKTKILLILEENELQNHVEKVTLEPEGTQEKSKYKKNEAKAKRILVDSIKVQFIPHVVAWKTSKVVYDALVGLFESNNINGKLTLRNLPRNVMITGSDFVVSYLMRFSQIKYELISIGTP